MTFWDNTTTRPSIEAMIWKLNKLKHAAQRLEDILYQEYELRGKDKDKDKLEFI